MNRLGLLICILSILSGCSSTGDRTYRDLDGEAKRVYLAYYPELSPEQRQELIEYEGTPYSLLQEWGIETKFFRERPRDIPAFTGKPENTSFTLRIESPKDVIDSGDSLSLRAFLDYRDGRSVEVTNDVRWSAEPSRLARFKDPSQATLTYECLHSEIRASATFLDEATGTKVIQFRKPIRSLELGLAESSQGTQILEYVELRAIARCEDGSDADVSCQADWRFTGSSGELMGCGQFRINRKASLADRSGSVSASYGGTSVTREFDFSRMLHRSR